ncbi:phosphoglycerate mutase-like protein [Morchella conica CCBAS932]|uniref:Phosphoglycerate mutase-like protein n=1 Tax=Morchella conica CCBAS932 TaxID=1392247 RepID=A0A3N4KYS0_9PEZI|nr:phosphoglycerate mutase-like protein [Morchella conica CCBAS932]
MGKPRLIILVRHAQSEGNKNRAIHQTVPDHRVKLTKEGNRQALEAGDRLLKLLRPEDTVQIITSPYTRTRETTAGIVQSLTPHPNSSTIKVYEEPRIREQDFGNFQPCSEEMERMWHERAAYGHFFYRIPNGESAADAYDRVSGFNESLWRQFAEDDFPSVLVLVTHGLMTRIFLMKWYHYSVEHFEDLRNVNHCEFVLMEKDPQTDKYILQNTLRTWSAYRKEQEEKRAKEVPLEIKKLEAAMAARLTYGGCVNGCNHPKNGFSSKEVTAQTLRDKLKVIEAGRDFGGSRSGAGSRVCSDDEASGGEEERPLIEGVGGGYKGRGGGHSGEPSDVIEDIVMQDQVVVSNGSGVKL